jgi:hypothetical protein
LEDPSALVDNLAEITDIPDDRATQGEQPEGTAIVGGTTNTAGDII